MTTTPPLPLFHEDEPRTMTAPYHIKHALRPVAECVRADLLEIARSGSNGRGYDLLASAPHIAAICADYVRISDELTDVALPRLVGLHVAALDYAAHPSQHTSVCLERAALRLAIVRLRDTGEIVSRSAMLLLQQLADDPCRCGSVDPTCACHTPVPLEAF